MFHDMWSLQLSAQLSTANAAIHEAVVVVVKRPDPLVHVGWVTFATIFFLYIIILIFSVLFSSAFIGEILPRGQLKS